MNNAITYRINALIRTNTVKLWNNNLPRSPFSTLPWVFRRSGKLQGLGSEELDGSPDFLLPLCEGTLGYSLLGLEGLLGALGC